LTSFRAPGRLTCTDINLNITSVILLIATLFWHTDSTHIPIKANYNFKMLRWKVSFLWEKFTLFWIIPRINIVFAKHPYFRGSRSKRLTRNCRTWTRWNYLQGCHKKSWKSTKIFSKSWSVVNYLLVNVYVINTCFAKIAASN